MREVAMPLQVIGAGFGRTGTLSLKLALEELGLGPCHHMEEVLAHPWQLPHWQAIADGRTPDWDVVFAGYGSTVDWPSAHVWRELAAFYPDAKVILTVRPRDAWWTSFSQTIAKVMAMRDGIPPGHTRDTMLMATTLIAEQTFGGKADDRETALAAFDRRVAEVRAQIPSGRLLVFDVAEGWGPLCGFLGRPVPQAPFPRANSTQEFWEHVKRSSG
jgi:hypothetical protein